MGIRALRSLLANSDKLHRLVWHEDREDGLDDRDIARISEAFPENSEVIRRGAADEMLEEVLRDYPLCREFRRRHVMGLKLIDPLHDRSDAFLIYDSDILTMHPVSGFCDFPDKETDVVFMHDSQYSYGFRLRQALAVPSGSMVRRLNAGCMLVRRSSVSYGQIEAVFERYPQLMERNDDQTVWALLAAGLNARMWDPEQVAIARADEVFLEECSVLHFVSPVRAIFHRFAEVAESRPAGVGRVAVRTVPSVRFGGADLFREVLERKLINNANRARMFLSRFGF